MERYSFEELKFTERKEKIRIFFLGNFYFDIDKNELLKEGDYNIENGELLFSGKPRKLEHLINNGFNNLKNSFTDRKAVYIHQNSGIPLIGTSYFGIVDRNTNLIEIRPSTGCNLDCIYCSINESGGKKVDYVLEAEYIIQEIEKLIIFKQENNIEVHINPQGEPLLYKPLAELVRGIKKIKQVKRISIDTNGTALNKKKVDELIDSGITQFNISIDSLSKTKAEEISKKPFPVEKIKDICNYISARTYLILAPIYLPGLNEDDIEDIVSFAKKLKIRVGIQNFLKYKQGKNSPKSISMEEFYKRLRELEKKYDIKLVYNSEDFRIHSTKKLPAPFKKDEVIDLEVVSPGRTEKEVIGKARNRVVEVKDYKGGKRMKGKIIRSKHNIFRATHVG